jgi:hypothetical protein
MKANQGPRSTFRDDTRGVSVMVGALLLVGIFVATMVTIRVAYVPVWEEDREASTSRMVERELGILKAELEHLTMAGDGLPSVHQVTLSRPSESAFRLPMIPSTIEYIDGNRVFRVSAPEFTVHHDNKTDHTRLNETYDTVGAGGATLFDIYELIHLRVRIDEVRSGAAYNNSHAQVQVFDKAGDAAGRIMVRIDDSGPGFRVIYETFDRWDTLVHTRSIGYMDGQILSPYFIDIEDPALRFNEILKATPGPYRLETTHTFPVGSVTQAFSYKQFGIGGEIVRASGGKTETGYHWESFGGTLLYDAQNRYFVENGWRIEHGGLILVQSDGVLMHQGPRMDVGIVRDNILRVSIVLPHFIGDGTSVSGSGSSALRLEPHAHHRLSGEADRLDLNLTTAHPTAWGAYFDQVMKKAGLVDTGPNPQYEVRTGVNWAELRIHGYDNDPNAKDLYLDLHHATVRLMIDR